MFHEVLMAVSIRVVMGLGMGLEGQGLLGVFIEWNGIIDAWCVHGLIPGALCHTSATP